MKWISRPHVHAGRVADFLALQHNTVGLLAMVVLVGMGERMAERFLPIYILALGGGTLAIGLLQAMENLLSALYSFPGGYLSDRLRIKRLLATDILIRFCEQIPYAFVVVWCMKSIAQPISALQFGFLTTIEMGVAMIVYIPVAYLADKSTKKPFILITFVFFTLFPLVLLFSHSFEWLIMAFILRGLKEFGEPTRKSLIMDLTTDHCKAGMFGLYYLIRDIVVSVAALGGAFLWQISPRANLVTAFLFGVVGTLGFAVFGKDISIHDPSQKPD